MNLVTLTDAAKGEILFNKPALWALENKLQ
jgi:hypothetical protein